jgi:phosphatidylserine decarboxylase
VVEVHDRRTGRLYVEPQVSEGALRALYGTVWGRWLLPLATSRLVSELLALPRRGRRSARGVGAFCDEFEVPLDEVVQPAPTPAAPAGWTSFAEFFVRDWLPDARPLPDDEEALVSPADGKLLVGTIGQDQRLHLKGVTYRLADLVGAWAPRFAGGTWFVVRLTVDDVHRYVHVASGRRVASGRAGRHLHTVGPWGDGRPVLMNRRWFTVSQSDRFGLVAQVEVGAILVGRIRDLGGSSWERGDPKGMFDLGGSTIVVLTEPGVVPDPDLVDWSARGTEIRVRARERIAAAAGRHP